MISVKKRSERRFFLVDCSQQNLAPSTTSRATVLARASEEAWLPYLGRPKGRIYTTPVYSSDSNGLRLCVTAKPR